MSSRAEATFDHADKATRAVIAHHFFPAYPAIPHVLARSCPFLKAFRRFAYLLPTLSYLVLSIGFTHLIIIFLLTLLTIL